MAAARKSGPSLGPAPKPPAAPPSGPGLDSPGTFRLGAAAADRVEIGRERAIEVDNTVRPPEVRINGALAPDAFAPVDFAEFYAEGGEAKAAGPGAPLAFPQTACASPTTSILPLGPARFRLGPPGYYEADWRACAAEGPATLLLWVDAGHVAGAGVAPAAIPRTAASCGSAGGPIVGRTTFQTLTPHAEVSLRVGPGAAVTLRAPAGVAAANLVISRRA